MVEIRKLQPLVKIRGFHEPSAYDRALAAGRPVIHTERRRKDFPPPTPQPTPCILWQGAVDKDGYGTRRTEANGPKRAVHRWIIEYAYGTKLGPRDVVMHLCDNPPCYRLEHLRVGTVASNNADARAKGRAVAPPIVHLRGELNGRSQLDWPLVRQIRAWWDDELRFEEIVILVAEQGVEITQSGLRKIIKRQRWHPDPLEEQP